MRPSILIAILMVLCAVPLTADPPRGWIGISFNGVDGLPKSPANPDGVAVEVTRVWGESPGRKAGLRQGDRVLAVDGKPLRGAKAKLAAAFKVLMDGKRPGDSATLRVWRRESRLTVKAGDAEPRPGAAPGHPDPIVDDPRAWLDGQAVGTKLSLEGARVERTFEVVLVLGTRPGMAADATIRDNAALRAAGLYPALPAGPTPLARLSERLVAASKTAADHRDLVQRLNAVEAGDDGFRLPLVRYLHRDPFAIRAATRALARDLQVGDGPLAGVSRVAFGILSPLGSVRIAAADPPTGSGRLTPEQLLDLLEASLARAHAQLTRALRGLSAEDQAFVAEHLGDLLDVFDEGIYLFTDTNRPRRDRVLRILRHARALDYTALEAAVAELAWLARRGPLAALLARVDWPKPGAAVLARRKTARGELLIGGRGRNVYRGSDAALIIDTGGDDVYHNNAGASVPGSIPIAVVVDLAGDDAYESHRRFAQGVGVLGVGLLVDHAGDDCYVGTSWTQGCGILGVGLLVDGAGDDRYRGRLAHQGVGLWGLGAVVDRAGNDRYDARVYAQGVGLSHGVGLLLDVAGDDEYHAKGLRPTGYGTPGVFDAWSQGCGLGFRLDASGGVGLLVDRAGRDRYEGGNFSQGGGYYFALGALLDGGRADDVYIGSRYAQGWSAHQAIGAFVEAGGNDRYRTRNAVNSGLAWDQSVTLFVDEAGDDRYQGGGFSQGASAHNAICLFLDLAGDDEYDGVVPARAGGNDYHGGTSWSLFVDAGGGKDVYRKPGKATLGNDRVRFRPTHSAFVDLPGTVESVLADGALDTLLPPPAPKGD